MLFRQIDQGTRQVFQLPVPGGNLQALTTGTEGVEWVGSCDADQKPGFLYTSFQSGNEQARLFYYQMQTQTITEISLIEGKCKGFCWSQASQKLAYTCTQQGQPYGIWIQDLGAKDQRAMTTEGSWYPMDWSPDGCKLVLQSCISNAESYPYLLDIQTLELTPLHPEKTGSSYCFQAIWSNTGQGIYYLSTYFADVLQVVYRDLATGLDQILTADQPWDAEHLSLSYQGDYLAYCLNQGGISQLQILELATGRMLTIPELPQGVISQLAFHPCRNELAVAFTSSNILCEIRVLDLHSRQWTSWFHTESDTMLPLPAVKAFTYKSFDQRQIPAFYYPGIQPKSPVLIELHGGPTEQSRPHYDKLFHFWRQTLGLAVISPNVRGSAGYGKAYMALDDGYNREDAVKDIGSLLDWIAEQPELDAERVCVYGGSYGGYLVLASLVHYPDRLKAGIELMGISHFVTYLENTSAERRPGRREEFGDERDPQMRDYLDQISPLTQAHQISQPLYVLHGLHDPRVPASEARQIVDALQKQGKEVWFALFTDEGHGLSKSANGDFFVYSATLFLKKFLLG